MFFRNDSERPGQHRSRKSSRRQVSRLRGITARELVYEPLEAREVFATFQAAGPASIINGSVEKVTLDNGTSGALHALLAHPTNADILYAGGANGGIWRTNNAQAASPHWVPLTDDMSSLSIGAMAMDPNNPNRILAGIGNYSAFASGGPLTGLMLTENGGNSWRAIDDPLLVGKNISGVAVDGNLLLATAGGGFFFDDPKPEGGIFRSTDGGATWSNIEVLPRDTLFPDEPLTFESFDLVADPTNPQRFYASVAGIGLFRSDDSGLNWTDVSTGNARISQLMSVITSLDLDNNNIEMAVAKNGRVYMAIISVGQPLYIGFSDSFGGAWTEMDIPLTLETTGVVGISPRQKPGGQGAIHFSIVADPVDPFTVYVGGDRQDGDLSFDSGNSIGARKFVGKLFRGDTRKASIGNVLDLNGFIPFNGYSPQWEHLTHSNLVPEMPQGGTRRGSAPHADSREMTFDAAGNLIQTDDGGIYRRTLPRSNQGDWYSVNGDLQVTEIHDIAYDSVSNILVAGTQDNNTVQQITAGGLVWETVALRNQEIVGVVVRRAPGDGGDVAVDDFGTDGYSYRYSSSQGLGGFRRQKYNTQNQLVEEIDLTPNIVGNFVTPVILNSQNSSRLVVGGRFGIFESFDRGNSFREVFGPAGASVGVLGSSQTSVVFGGSKSGVANAGLLYVGSGNEVFVRTAQNENLRLTRAQYPGGDVRDLAVDSSNWSRVFVIDRDDLYLSNDTGDTWRNMTGNLHSKGAGELRSLIYVSGGAGVGYLVAGTNSGVFVTSANSPGKWIELGNVPNAYVSDLEYDAKDNILAVGTMGRGAFLLKNALAEIAGTAQDAATRTASGLIYNDVDGDRVRDPGEGGLGGITVYVDLNGDDRFNVNEPAAVTAANGSYLIDNIPKGTFAVRLSLQPGWIQTTPIGTGEFLINFATTEQATNLLFGIREGSGSEMGFDFGDAPAPFPTLLVDNGASHGIVPGFHLGNTVDGDFDGRPSPFAGGDDNVGDDEDGIVFVTEFVPGSEATIQVTISNGTQSPGVLQGWIDFNGDGSWSTAGEQVFRDVAVKAGVNTLTINVPAWAQLGSRFSRFRYGYERGISYTGRAVAGEVEDHLIELIKGGPTANDDSYVVRRNSVDTQLPVLANDTLSANSQTTISGTSSPSQGGSVRIGGNGTVLLYTPRAGFSGTETFSYTLTDRNGLSDTAAVAVFVQPDLAGIRLGATTPDGAPLSTVTVGQTFLLRGYVQDLTSTAGGVFAAYLDVEFPSAAASVTGAITYGVDFPNGQSGATGNPGLIDEVGAFDGLDRIGAGEALLFSVPMRANQAGNFAFSVNPADILPQHNVLLFDRDDAVPTDQIEYRGISLTFTQPVVPRLTNPRNSLDVNDDTSVSPLDALLVINQLNDSLSLIAEGEDRSMYLDVSADGQISPLDALLVINELNRQSRAEGESTLPVTASVAGEPHETVFASLASTDAPSEIDSILALLGDDLIKRRTLNE